MGCSAVEKEEDVTKVYMGAELYLKNILFRH
jgi:hypothetical protein